MTVENVWVGRGAPTSARVRAKVTGTTIRLAVDTDEALSSPTYFNPSSVDEGIATIDAVGLSANTQYFYAVEEDGVLDTTFPGSFRTFPEAGQAATFAFAASGDAGLNPDYPGEGAVLASNRLSNHPVFDTIRTHSTAPLFDINMGDLTYYDLGSDNHGITGGGSLDNYRRQIDDVLTQPRQHELYRNMPLVYTWDDHCFGPNNSDGTNPNKDNAATVYRERVPSYNLPDADGAIYHSFVVGRVLFIVWDTRYHRSPSSDPDGPEKTMLGAAQKSWMRDLLETTSAEALVVVSSVHWILTTSDNESWGSYATERDELAAMFADTGWADRMIMLHADRHTIAMDSGASNDWGRFPTYGLAGLDATPHAGPWPHDLGFNSERGQYGIVRVADDGDSITFTTRGYKHGTESSILSHDYTITITEDDSAPPTTPNVPVTPGEVSQRVTWVACNLVSGDIITELPEIHGEVSRVVGAYTSSSLVMPIPIAGPGKMQTHRWEQATAPGQTMICPIVNNVPAAGLIILNREGGTPGELNLATASLEAYLEHRFVGDHLWEGEDEAAVIAAGIIADAQTQGINLIVDAPATGVLRDREYFDKDDATVYKRLVELMEIDNGIEWTIDVDWASDAERSITKVVRVAKRIGVESSNPTAVFATEGDADVTYQYKESYAGGDGANHVIATSSGQGDDRPQSAAISDVRSGWPRWEKRFSPSSSIKHVGVLNDHARAELARLRDGTRSWHVEARWNAWPRLGIDWRLGDDVRLELVGHRHPHGVTVVRRAIGWKLNMQSGLVKPIFVGGD